LTRLIDLFRNGSLTLSEYQEYLDQGYEPSDTAQLQSGRSAEMVTMSYMNLGSGRSWELKENETVMGYIGPSSGLVNAGNMIISGDALFLYNSGNITNTGTITITGNLTLKSY
jgi:hypothetical protein